MSGRSSIARAITGAGRQVAASLLLAAFVAVLPLGGRAAAGVSAEPALVAASSNLQFALEKIAAAFEAETGHRLRLTFGSSGNLARQIRQGAPFELLLAADEQYVLDLADDGFARDRGVVYGVGRLVLFVPEGSSLEPDGSLDDLASALAEGRLARFAIANPDHAPYGQRARQALRHKGLWETIRPRLVFGENVSQAAQFAASGNVEGGLIPYSLALAPAVSARGAFALVPEEWHSPLYQRMVLMRGAGSVAEEFYSYLQGPAARTVFDHHGYVLPDATGQDAPSGS